MSGKLQSPIAVFLSLLLVFTGLVPVHSFSDNPSNEMNAPEYMPAYPGKNTQHNSGVQLMSQQKSMSTEKSNFAPLPANPVTGVKKVLVIPIEFVDVKFEATHDQAYWNDMLFSSAQGAKSLRNFYLENSYGQLDVQGVVAPVVTSLYNMADYGGDDPVTGETDVAFTGGIDELAREAVQLLDQQGFDFSPFDQDGDGIVDHVFIIHAGYGQEGQFGTSDDIWSHRYVINETDGQGNIVTIGELTDDGVAVINYTMEPDDGQVGVFAHEFGHDLGLPDLYDIDYSTEGAGPMALMGSGGWNGVNVPGDSPAHLSAWSKMMLGWITPTTITSTQDITINNAEQNKTGAFYKLPASGTNGAEYFLIENRQKIGFDEGLPGDGLLIWHVDQSLYDPYLNDMNADENHPMVALEQADGLNELLDPNLVYIPDYEADPYPGTTWNYTFTNTTNPNSNTYAGSDSLVRIAVTSESASVMTAKVSVTGVDVVPPEAGVDPYGPGFSPNGNNNMEFNIYTNEPVNVTVTIATYSDQTQVATLANNNSIPDGVTPFYWDGFKNDGTLAADGTYIVSLTATDIGGNVVTDEVPFLVENVNNSLLGTIQTSTTQFDPTSQTVTFSTNLNVTQDVYLGDSSVTSYVYVEILNSSNSVIKSVYDDQMASGTIQFTWDGTDNSGNTVNDGNYWIKVIAEDGNGIDAARKLVTVQRIVSTGGGGGGGGGAVVEDPAETEEEMPGVIIEKDVPVKGGEIEVFNGNIKLVFDDGTFDEDSKLTVQVIQPGNIPDHALLAGGVYDIKTAGNLKKKVKLMLKVREDVLANIDDLRKAAVYTLNETSGQWELVGGFVDPETGTITVELEHFSIYTVLVNNKQFTDVDGHWSEQYVEILASRNLIDGYQNGSFQPNKNISRAEFTKLIVSALGMKLEEGTGATFEDMSGHWSSPYVEAAVSAGIVNGRGDQFSPDDSITREEAVAIIVRAAALNNLNEQAVNEALTQFNDGTSVESWAQSSVAEAVHAGIISGRNDNSFDPKGNTTRAEASKMILKLLEEMGEFPEY